MKNHIKIDDDVKAVLRNSTITGNVLTLPPGRLDFYARVKKTLEALGGSWNRGKQGFLFENGVPREAFEQALEKGQVFDKKKAFQFYETPPDVAQMMVEKLCLSRAHSVLEPSAGRGAIIKAVQKEYGQMCVHFCEIQSDNREILLTMPNAFLVHQFEHDFLKLSPRMIGAPFRDSKGLFDRIAMNPPFADFQDIDHVTHALQFLKPGGRLVAIMSLGITFRTGKKITAFKRLVKERSKVYDLDVLPEGTFRTSGTDVRTCILTIQL